jgi:hypothetical protein
MLCSPRNGWVAAECQRTSLSLCEFPARLQLEE